MRHVLIGAIGLSLLMLLSGTSSLEYTSVDLDELSTDTCIDSIADREWDNIRIHVHHADRLYLNPKMRNAASLIRETAIPEVLDFWEQSMKVRRVPGSLRFLRDCTIDGTACSVLAPSVCSAEGLDDFEIPFDLLSGYSRTTKSGAFGQAEKKTVRDGPGVAADLVLLVDISDHPGCLGRKGSDEVASAFVCRSDACGRPILGVINICVAALDPTSARSLRDLRTTISHELTHVFGFSADSIPLMRFRNGAPRVPPSRQKTVLYTCGLNPQTRLPSVRWDVDSESHVPRGAALYSHTFSPGIVAAIDTSCRCPLDSSVVYSSADIEHCLANPCGLAIVTPTVAAMSQWYFNCSSVTGAALETQSGPSCEILDPHWKIRFFKGEYMGAVQDENVQHISPITWAFLDDTGWYRMDYSQTSSLVPGAFWGFKEGCAFVDQPCSLPKQVSSRPWWEIPMAVSSTDFTLVEAQSAIVLSDAPEPSLIRSGSFCSDKFAQPLCSANALHLVQCNAPHGSPWMDFCPVSVIQASCQGPSRCLHLANGPAVRGVCVAVVCSGNSSYSVNGSGECHSAGERIAFDGEEIICADPKVVCHDFSMPHIGGSSFLALPSATTQSEVSRLESAAIALGVDHKMVAIPPRTPKASANLATYALFALVLSVL